MSEPKLITPMLDNYAMGKPISEHNGVCCCPAMEKDSDKKYIVKIISIPASALQLDALLLSGAFPDKKAALDYFRELADGVAEEALILQKLSRLEGFLPYESWQVEEAQDGTGYDIYLLSTYKRSLERHFLRSPMTHLGAVNLGLDLCASAAVCRRAGYLCVDIKPGNVFISDKNEYRLGDLGFISLESLKFASLPDRYRSSYTAPEITDAFATLNTTIDIYAIGLILYQAYNNGKLPFEGAAPSEAFPAPEYADYEMAEIILKACAPSPEERWQDPIEMGQALVSYMQRNSVDNTPIVPPPAPVFTPPGQAAAPSAESGVPEEAEDTDETFPDDQIQDELGDTAITMEVSEMLAQADALIAHETPEPVVAPEPIDVPVPPPLVSQEEAAPEAEEEPVDDDLIAQISEAISNTPVEVEVSEEPPDPKEEPAPVPEQTSPAKKKRGRKGWIIAIVALVLIAVLCFGGYFYYSNYYLLTVNGIALDGSENQLTVTLDTNADSSLLKVVCTDTYGNTQRVAVTNGTAVFTDLTPGALYTIKVEADGSHRLQGKISETYTTPAQTKVISFSAVAGAEDGSVVLNFTVEGPEAEQWQIFYTAEEEDEKQIIFSGHMVAINGLTVGKTYTFRLASDEGLYIVGGNTLDYTATALVLAQNPTITGCDNETLQVKWDVPEGASVESWTVRCYSESGYDQSITTTELFVEFTEIDCSAAYTVEITAAGMTQSSRTFMTANSQTISNLQANTSNPNRMQITWESTGTTPEGGWLLMYTIDDSEKQEVIRCENTSGTISPVIPGATYEFTLQAADGATVFGGSTSYTVPEAQAFSGYGATSASMTFSMCRTPKKENWTRRDLTTSSYTTAFAAGENASFLVRVKAYSLSDDKITVLYIIRDENGGLVSTVVSEEGTWSSMWDKYGYCTLDIPALPQTPGNYTMDIYFNGSSAATQSFTITEAAQ